MAHISTLDYAMEAPQRHVGQPFPVADADSAIPASWARCRQGIG